MTDINRWIVQTENGPVEVVEAKQFDDFKSKSEQAGFWGRSAARQVIANRKLKERNDALQARLDAIDSILSEENGEVSPDYFDRLWVALHPTKSGYEYVGLPVPDHIKE